MYHVVNMAMAGCRVYHLGQSPGCWRICPTNSTRLSAVSSPWKNMQRKQVMHSNVWNKLVILYQQLNPNLLMVESQVSALGHGVPRNWLQKTSLGWYPVILMLSHYIAIKCHWYVHPYPYPILCPLISRLLWGHMGATYNLHGSHVVYPIIIH